MLPRLQEAARRNPHAVEHLRNCTRCMQSNPAQTRQWMACAYESPVDGARAWQSPDYTGLDLSTCPGYTTSLPEVMETAEVRFYLNKGSLPSLIGGEVTENIRHAVTILESSDNEVVNWALKNPEK